MHTPGTIRLGTAAAAAVATALLWAWSAPASLAGEPAGKGADGASAAGASIERVEVRGGVRPHGAVVRADRVAAATAGSVRPRVNVGPRTTTRGAMQRPSIGPEPTGARGVVAGRCSPRGGWGPCYGYGFGYCSSGYRYGYDYHDPRREAWGFRRGYPYWSDTAYGGLPLYEVARRLDPALVDEPTVESPAAQPRDEALDALRGGRYAEAAERYAARASGGSAGESAEGRTAALLAMALVGADRPGEAARVFAAGQDADPSVWADPVDGRAIVGVSAMRALVTRAVTHARRLEAQADRSWSGGPADRARSVASSEASSGAASVSPPEEGRHESAEATRSAWLLVAMLMQADGRNDAARRFVARARGEG